MGLYLRVRYLGFGVEGDLVECNILGAPSGTLHYTTDGTEPTLVSPAYSAAVRLMTASLRFALLDSGGVVLDQATVVAIRKKSDFMATRRHSTYPLTNLTHRRFCFVHAAP